MNIPRRHLLGQALAAGASMLPLLAAGQAPFPARPVKLVVPFATGGASDTFARTVGQVLGERLGQPFVVENRTGAGGTVAANAVAKAPADGHTLLVGDIGTHGISTSLYGARLGYDALKDFAPISFSVVSPMVLVATPSLPVQDARELIAYARANPGKVAYASSGSGGISHLAVEQLKSMANVYMLHIPYKGGAPALTDVMSGQVQVMILSLATSLPHIRAGRVRALAVASRRRAALLPEVPTLHEGALPNYVVEPWLGILAPAGTPRGATDVLQREFAAVLGHPAVREKLGAQGFEVVGGQGDELARVVRADVTRWAAIVRQSGAQVE